MKNNRNLSSIVVLLLLFIGSTPLTATGNEHVLTSPNGKLKIEINTDNQLSYQVTHQNNIILSYSDIGIVLEDGTVHGQQPQVTSKKVKKTEDNIRSPFYRFNQFIASGNELNLKFKDGFGIIFRIYNEGIAYRFYTTHKQDISIKNEIAGFNFNNDYTAYLSHSTNEKEPFSMAFQNIYEAKPISQSSKQIAFLPATIDLGNQLKMTILESDLEAYPGMFLQADGTNLKGVFAPLPARTDYYPWRKQEYITERQDIIARTEGTRQYPWRILAITERDIDMPVNNLVYTLASPNRIGDCSWIEPGKAAWDWWNDWGNFDIPFKSGINTETYKYHIDFASRYGLQYVILDEGWYEPKSGDMMTVVPEIDLPALVEYANSKGVKLILWTVFNVLDDQLEKACAYYSSLGIAGFKVDFLDRDDQKAVEMVYRIAEGTARHKLLLNLHGIYKPTGLNRTYPHIVNFEGVFGMEEAKWSTIEKDMPQYDVTVPFIRMMAGPMDFTPGAMRNATKRDFKPIYNNPMSQGTRCHQLAMYIVYDSPLTMLCDAPTLYQKEDAYTRFLSSIPVEVEETCILDGKMGEYIITVRRKENSWYIGGLTNWNSLMLTVDFSFLPKGKLYKATIFCDGMNADKQASDYQTYTKEVTTETLLDIRLASGGGFAIRLEEALDYDRKPGNVPSALGLYPFYKKYLDADGIPIVSSEKVRDEALMRACRVINQMLSKRPDIKKYMVEKGCKVMIIGEKEEVCDIPEYAHICDTPENIAYWNRRARGFGGAPEHEFSASCGEENVLGLLTDRYLGESILVHEFAHIFHLVGICGIESDFNDKLENLRQNAIAKDLWKDTYCITNKEEYFAETVQSFFNCNRYVETANGVHNAINTRWKLKKYDPDMYQFLLQYLPEIDLDLENNQKH
ncbi:glycoside hydrolase family 97 catalytic domain-containing protein [Bacteroides sp. 519]|uniref:glycoside hydrolase family 97 catalytic domain-containing protein n=1 Tax=Bacteroides sp. 519 TaxID=2302937 RepID=UPI0013D79907|nr:glycoside hydrolase family 97 catalytic domain-containing protein [Bacteroides sp. 519]NDV58482.1 glycoside hydrolase family 97 protein [Bacteroides sp. 519]